MKETIAVKLDEPPSTASASQQTSLVAKRRFRARNAALTRAAIFEVAKKYFSEANYDEVRHRDIANTAGANSALISHYFGSKEGLFAEVIRELIDPRHLIQGDRSTFGKRMSEYIFRDIGSERALESIYVIIRASTSPTALRIVQDASDQYFTKPLAEWLGGRDAHIRAHMIRSNLLGVISARLVNKSLNLRNGIMKSYAKNLGVWLQEVVDGALDIDGLIFSQIKGGRERYSGYLYDGDKKSIITAADQIVKAGCLALTDKQDVFVKPNLASTKSTILSSAAKHFTEWNYETVGLRAIASDANIDVALILRHFGSKHDLFLAVVESLMNPRSLTDGDRSTFGERIASAIYGSKSIDPSLMNIFLILRSAMSPTALPVIQEIGSEAFAKPFTTWLGGDNAELRANCMLFAIYGSVQSRLLEKEGDASDALLCLWRRHLAIGLQAFVDDAWQI